MGRLPERAQSELSAFLASLRSWAETQDAVKRLRLFGSFARGDFGRHSDVDLALELEGAQADSWAFLASDFREKARTLRALDLVDPRNCSEELRRTIAGEGLVIYERKRFGED